MFHFAHLFLFLAQIPIPEVMLFFCHLFIGCIIGLAITVRTRDRRAFLFCAIGAILPDLIDKPLGHILLQNTVDNGRLIAHSLLFLILILLISFILLRFRHRSALPVFCLAMGILSHQIADYMWKKPANWYFPFCGSWETGSYPDYFSSMILTELGSPTEWLFAAAVLILFAGMYHDGPGERVCRPLSCVLIGCGVFLMLCAFAGWAPPLMVFGRPEDLFFLGSVMILGGVMLGMFSGKTEIPENEDPI